MPSANKTELLGLNQWQGNEYLKRQDLVDDNKKIDDKMKEFNTSLSDMVQDTYPTVTTTGTNSYVGSTTKIKSLGKGVTKLTLFVVNDATGNCSLNLNSYGVKNIKDSFGNIVTNLKKDIPYNLCYNGTDFILQGKGGGGDAAAAQLLINKKATVDTGPIVGTMPDNGAINQSLEINGAYTIPAGFHNGSGKVIQSIPTKAGATINPSTIAQIISAGQYLTGDQIISAITGTATDNDVVAGKTYNSSAGILRTGNASISSLGGYLRAQGTIPGNGTNSITISGLSFTPKTAIVTCYFNFNYRTFVISGTAFVTADTNTNGNIKVMFPTISAGSITIPLYAVISSGVTITYEIYGN